MISIYNKITNINSEEVIDIDIFLDNIKTGHWQDQVLGVRTNRVQKTSLPSVTISGTFASRRDNALIDHSGYICIDIDKCDPNDVKEQLCTDEHLFACFTSVSGYGIAAIFRITPSKHKEAFYGLGAYLKNKYGLVVDPTAVNVSRARFVSYDPDLYRNGSAKKFTQYPAKRKKEKTTKVIFVKNDFDEMVKQIQTKGIDLTYDYQDWLRIGFGLAEKFGEGGRHYFHAISEMSSKYNSTVCDKQYDACIKANGSGITIATFYWLAKNAGIESYSPKTNDIIKKTNSMKRGGMSNSGIIDNLLQFSDYTLEELNEIVPQVEKDTIVEDISTVEEVQNFIKMNYNIRRNVISRNIEMQKNDGFIPMKSEQFNSLYLRIKKEYEKTSFDLMERIILSEETVNYNPLHKFLEDNININPTGVIDRLSNCIESSHGLEGDERGYFLKKWLCGVISAMHMKHSPLMLVLSGRTQNTGKSEFFRRLLPKQLKPYYAESKLDAGKDDEILMTQKLIIMDDEMGGKSKREAARLKELTSKQTFSLREPYGRNNVDLDRLAVLCGTSNLDDLLNDPTGNRRIIPIHVKAIDHDKYNAIDKVELFMEAYHLYKSGFQWQMSKDDIELLSRNTKGFEAVNTEVELVLKYFRIPKHKEEGKYYTSTDLRVLIEMLSRQKMYDSKLTAAMQNLGLIKKSFKVDGRNGRGYKLVRLYNEPDGHEANTPEPEGELPF